MKWCRLVVAWQAREGEDRKKRKKRSGSLEKENLGRTLRELGEKQGQPWKT